MTSEVKRQQRKRRIRAKLHGTADCPRLTVFRSNKNITAQLIDDNAGKTLASSSNLADKVNNMESAAKVGADIAKKAASLKIESCVFDRNGYKYHGRVKALADSAREGGLKF